MLPTVLRVSPGRLEIREGGGCLTLFGTPFLAGGLFTLLGAVGLVPFEDRRLGPWGPPLMMAMSLALLVAGGWLALWRTWIIADTSRGTLWLRRGLLVPMGVEEHRLSEFATVRLGHLAEDSDTDSAYPVSLRREGSAPELRVCCTSDWRRSRRVAAELAELLQLPLEDASTEHATILRPEQLHEPLAQRLRRNDSHEPPTPPATLRSAVERAGGAVRIRIPEAAFRWTMLLPVLIVVGAFACFGPGALEFFERTHTPEPVQWFFGVLAVLFVGFIPLSVAIASIVNAVRGYTDVAVTEREIRVEERHAWRRRRTAVPTSGIFGLDFGLSRSLVQRGAGRAPSLGRRAKRAAAGRPRKARTASNARDARGVLVKHRGGILALGSDLPDEEVKYLYLVIREALSGH